MYIEVYSSYDDNYVLKHSAYLCDNDSIIKLFESYYTSEINDNVDHLAVLLGCDIKGELL